MKKTWRHRWKVSKFLKTIIDVYLLFKTSFNLILNFKLIYIWNNEGNNFI